MQSSVSLKVSVSHLESLLKRFRTALSIMGEFLTCSPTTSIEADFTLWHRKNPEAFRQDLLAIARTTLSSKVLAADKDYFAELAVSAVLRLKVGSHQTEYISLDTANSKWREQGSTDLEHIQIIKKQGGKLTDSYLDEGFILDKKIGVNCPHKIENAKILIANTRESKSHSRRPFQLTGSWSIARDSYGYWQD